MSNAVIIENLTVEEFDTRLEEAVRKAVAEVKPESYVTRYKACELLHVSLPTLDKAIHQGKLRASKINGRVLFKAQDIEAALTPMPARSPEK